MIFGIGNDLVDIRRIEKTLINFGARFINRILKPQEALRVEGDLKRRASYVAKRFAAKEALIKALGGGNLNWHDIMVTNDESGKPQLSLLGNALDILQQKGINNYKIDVSLSDEYPYAQAFVVISYTKLHS